MLKGNKMANMGSMFGDAQAQGDRSRAMDKQRDEVAKEKEQVNAQKVKEQDRADTNQISALRRRRGGSLLDDHLDGALNTNQSTLG